MRPRVTAALETHVGTAFRIASTFFVVSLCWVFFRPDLDKALIILERMFTIPQLGETLPLHNRGLWYTVLFLLGCHLLVASGLWKKLSERLPSGVLGFGYALTLTTAMTLAPQQGAAFIYFTF